MLPAPISAIFLRAIPIRLRLMCGVIGDAGYAHYPATATVKRTKAGCYCNSFACAISSTRFVILTKVRTQDTKRGIRGSGS
jgi:hypothetical protein